MSRRCRAPGPQAPRNNTLACRCAHGRASASRCAASLCSAHHCGLTKNGFGTSNPGRRGSRLPMASTGNARRFVGPAAVYTMLNESQRPGRPVVLRSSPTTPRSLRSDPTFAEISTVSPLSRRRRDVRFPPSAEHAVHEHLLALAALLRAIPARGVRDRVRSGSLLQSERGRRPQCNAAGLSHAAAAGQTCCRRTARRLVGLRVGKTSFVSPRLRFRRRRRYMSRAWTMPPSGLMYIQVPCGTLLQCSTRFRDAKYAPTSSAAAGAAASAIQRGHIDASGAVPRPLRARRPRVCRGRWRSARWLGRAEGCQGR